MFKPQPNGCFRIKRSAENYLGAPFQKQLYRAAVVAAPDFHSCTLSM